MEGKELAVVQYVLAIDIIVMMIQLELHLYCCNVAILSPGHSQTASNSQTCPSFSLFTMHHQTGPCD
jgi:hypothetical protein